MFNVKYSSGEYTTVGRVDNQKLVCINSLGEKCYIPIDVNTEIDIGQGYEAILGLIGRRELVYNKDRTMIMYKNVRDKMGYGFSLF